MNNILVTGANGYIGRNLGGTLRKKGFNPIAAVREFKGQDLSNYFKVIEIGNISGKTDWSEALVGIDCIVHLAARAHMTSKKASAAIAVFREVNRDATLKLATQAADSGVRRFIYVSSIGVLGNNSNSGAFSNASPYAPVEPYAISKMEAEVGLKKIADATGLDVVIVRPPLVYGVGAPGNFHRLLKLVNSDLPLPLGCLNEKKSMVSLENLLDFLAHCIILSKASNKMFVISDDEDLSTTELIRLMARFMGKDKWLYPLPVGVLKFLASLVGQRSIIEKLSSRLQIDCSPTMELLDWRPLKKTKIALKEVVEQFDSKRGSWK